VTKTASLSPFLESSWSVEQNGQDFNVIKQKNNSWSQKYESIGLTLECVLNTDEAKIRENITANLKRFHSRVWPHKAQETPVVICAGGPSLLDSIEEIREKQINGAKVIALANTAHVLVKHGIRPNAHVLLDAKPRNAEFILPNVETTYFIASQCCPEVFDKAEATGNRILMYHAVNNDEEFQCIKDVEEMWVPVQGGSTITMRAIRLFTLLGYMNFETYGWDSCLRDGRHHAYEQPDADKQRVFKFEVEGKLFKVTPWMISQAFELINFVKMFCMNININVHGDGLIAHIIKQASIKHSITEDK
jgi:Protein of unknown function DUF115